MTPRERLLALLESLEWCGRKYYDMTCCPICWNVLEGEAAGKDPLKYPATLAATHADECELKAVLELVRNIYVVA